jgi:predicted nucleic acid-binding protein
MIGARPLFVDTSGWYALADMRDGGHDAAARRFRRATGDRRQIVTTNHVVGESYTLLMGRLGPRIAQTFLGRVRSSSILQRVHVIDEWEIEAERLLVQYHDQRFSYVDATSFVTMRQLGIQDALALDSDFVIAGFTLVGDE